MTQLPPPSSVPPEFDPRDAPPRWEPLLGRFSLRSIFWATTFAAFGAAAFSAGYYVLAVVGVALTVAAFIAFAPVPSGAGQRWWITRWVLRMLAGAVWGAVVGTLVGLAVWITWPELNGSWKAIYIPVLCGAVFGLVFARSINFVFMSLFRLLRVFLPS